MPDNQSSPPFGFIPLNNARSTNKPRRCGLTMMMDWGLPLETQRAWLELQAKYVDLAKFVAGTARLYEREYLLKKIALYKQFDVAPFIGGQFLEYTLAKQGMEGADRYFKEAVELGFVAIEVSDNYVPLQSDTRRALIQNAIAHGLEAHGEVGSKTVETDASLLIGQATECFSAGANVVLVEGAELLIDGEPSETLLRDLKAGLDTEKVIFELSGTWIPDTTQADVYQLKKFLISEFGPDVNLANILPDQIWETEALRVGLSTIGPTVTECL